MVTKRLKRKNNALKKQISEELAKELSALREGIIDGRR